MVIVPQRLQALFWSFLRPTGECSKDSHCCDSKQNVRTHWPADALQTGLFLYGNKRITLLFLIPEKTQSSCFSYKRKKAFLPSEVKIQQPLLSTRSINMLRLFILPDGFWYPPLSSFSTFLGFCHKPHVGKKKRRCKHVYLRLTRKLTHTPSGDSLLWSIKQKVHALRRREGRHRWSPCIQLSWPHSSC